MNQQTQAVVLSEATSIKLPELLEMMAMDPQVTTVNGVIADGVYRIDVPCGSGFESRVIGIRDGHAVELIERVKTTP